MSLSRLHRNEIAGMAGAILLGIGVFLNWYTTDSTSRFSEIQGHRGSFSCWDVHPILRWLLLAATIAPFILAWIIASDIRLSWARGEMTMVTSVAAFGLIVYNGLISRPGNLGITLDIGWYLALLGSIAMVAAAALRSSATERPRKPPGTI
ncbi:MAG TPA: hypothetical protein VFT42_03000 [Solirubrobacteraceae bacterium]|nr:hypothetical protein [Solirubrobacteraceae bacterium]